MSLEAQFLVPHSDVGVVCIAKDPEAWGDTSGSSFAAACPLEERATARASVLISSFGDKRAKWH